MSETQKINKTAGEIKSIPCLKCTGSTQHKILSSVDISGHVEEYHGDIFWDEHYQVIQCQGCKIISFRETEQNSENWGPEGQYEEGVTLYPSRVQTRKRIDSRELRYIPKKLRDIYLETSDALNNNLPILTGIGLRAIVETVCKEQNAKGANLLKKIDNLVSKNILTPAGSAILHKIRTLGNSAAHEVKPHSEKQLSVAMDVIEHLFKDLYILPKQVESEFEK